VIALREPYVPRLADHRRLEVPGYFWVAMGAGVLLVGGVPLFVAWLTPGVPPPGPLG
jgi:hypothetical protein